ncbi:hypothetical protein SY83_03085 [Paenibacillus swuensis]|uniref:Heparin-sulfate lyase N-terminal domain-containing protein n=1 Tax=Paenibacillus swuensis TaxID=1178515 RepID=A0A172TFB6_9BACL|nr:hypothetical protein [Paenibacillus swuensis]ANE45473.1 hypothetical protein SY83_03085 [Paenibacillus swuensis]
MSTAVTQQQQQRNQVYLQDSAGKETNDHRFRIAAQALSRLASGLEVDEQEYRDMLETVDQRLDCGDFTLNIVLRTLYLYGNSPLWSAALKEETKRVLLEFEYWYDAERNGYSGEQYFVTENHVLLYRVCQLLAGQRYPDETFSAHGTTGRDWIASAEALILEWIQTKAMVGFSEWDSNTYMVENYMSLLNVHDFATSEPLRHQARQMLDLMSYGMAVNSYKGVYGCSHGRTYSHLLLNPETESTRALQYLLWGIGGYKDNLLDLGGVCLATSKYECPDVITQIAEDQELTVESKEQQSFNVEDAARFGKGTVSEEDAVFFWKNMAYTHQSLVQLNKQIEEKYGIQVNHELDREIDYFEACEENEVEPEPCRGCTYLSKVNKITYKTPHYMLSCAQDYRKGERGFQQHIWQATLDEGAVVFVNHPGAPHKETGRPDYWAGNDVFPRAVQVENSLMAIHHIPADSRVPYSHAYFPRMKFDEVLEEGGWIFGRKNEGYVALYSQNGYRWAEDPELTGTEVICDALHNIWICQAGSAAEHGSFRQFAEYLVRNGPQFSEQSVKYTAPSGNRMEFGWDGPLLVNNEEWPIANYKRFDNVFCQTERFSGLYEIAWKGQVVQLQF